MPAVAFRLPTQGGPLTVYKLPDLEATRWGAGARTAGAYDAVGVDLQGRRLLYRDSVGGIASLDLVALRERTVAPRGALAALGADGTLLAVATDGTVLESHHWGVTPWPTTLGRRVRAVFAAPGGRILALRDASADTLATFSRDGLVRAVAAPEAADRAAAFDGDAVAFATDSGLVVVEERESDRPWFVRLSGTPRAAIFSPSGHQVFVALQGKHELAVVDRFGRAVTSTIPLPGPAAALRADPWGRAILVRPSEQPDVVWIVGVADHEVRGELRTRWASDLPVVAEDGVILAREEGAVVARDVRSLDSVGAVAGGAADLWFTGRWVARSASAAARSLAQDAARPAGAPTATTATAPRERPAERSAAAQPPRTTEAAPPPAAARAEPRASAPPEPPAPPGNFWAQVTSTRFPEGARALADTLRTDGHPAQVIAPRPADNIWRVMTGPYRSREAADSAGRALGRPYFIVDRNRQ